MADQPLTGFALIDGRADDPWPRVRARSVLTASVILVLTSVASYAVISFAAFFVRAFGRGLIDKGVPALPEPLQVALALALIGIGASAGTLIYAIMSEGRPLRAYGLVLHWGPIARWAAFGLALAVPGALIMSRDVPSAMLAIFVAFCSAPVWFAGAAAEEAVFRGWLLQTIGARHGAVVAIAASSLLFGLAHVASTAPSDALQAVLIRLPLAIVCALLALRDGHLSSAIGLHMGWNIIVTSTSVSTVVMETPAWGDGVTLVYKLLVYGALVTLAFVRSEDTWRQLFAARPV